MSESIRPTGVERRFAENEVIVSKTDLRGHITYANSVFVRLAGWSEQELLGAPHSIVRHPDMPRCVFKLLWDRIQAGHEVFAYVLNMSRNGDHYWVHAHVTPTFDAAGKITGYHSNRRVADAESIAAASAIYAALLAEEKARRTRPEGLTAGTALLEATLAKHGVTYDQWVWSI